MVTNLDPVDIMRAKINELPQGWADRGSRIDAARNTLMNAIMYLRKTGR